VSSGQAVAKGHGTENDFVLLPDPDGRLDLRPGLVAALCDRRAGIGADGVLRVVRSARLPEGQAGEAEWFMDYRNGDGSMAEICGNGLRVFVTYLLHTGLAHLRDGEAIRVGTRSGVKTVRRDGDLLAADLGRWRIVGGRVSAAAGADLTVRLPGQDVALPGLAVDVGNPHVVVALPADDQLQAADLTRVPVVQPAQPHGINVELIVPSHRPGAGVGQLRMRVRERGSGETRSCGTGAVAAALAARVWAGDGAPDVWWVDVPGGRLRVTAPPGDPLAGAAVELAGPAVIVAEGHLDPGWLAANTANGGATGQSAPLLVGAGESVTGISAQIA
jgi:diaminopimelate epimerase